MHVLLYVLDRYYHWMRRYVAPAELYDPPSTRDGLQDKVDLANRLSRAERRAFDGRLS